MTEEMTEEMQTIEAPADPIAAVIHPDPYPFYRSLVADRPLTRDPVLGIWVAASASAATAVLTSSACRVRPSTSFIPPGIVGSPAAEIFRHLVRMNDGEAHDSFKLVIGATLDHLEPHRLRQECELWAARLGREIGPTSTTEAVTQFADELSLYVLGSLLGVDEAELGEVVAQVKAFVRCIFPGGTVEQIDAGKVAAGRLQSRFQHQLQGVESDEPNALFVELERQARCSPCDTPKAVIANALGLMIQSYDATAGLIASTVLTLARKPDLRRHVVQMPASLGAIIDEVLRFDSPVQNTRRFVAEPVRLEGQELQEGDTVLVVLAAANRDPRANPRPDDFDPSRSDPQLFTFGLGPHACPGRAIAATIATAAVERLLRQGIDLDRFETRPPFRPSVNARIPDLSWKGNRELVGQEARR